MRVKQNNEWINMSQEIQWRMNNEWQRHSSANYPNYYVLEPNDWVMVGTSMIQYFEEATDPYIVIPETDMIGSYPTYQVVIPRGMNIQGVATGSAELKITDYLFAGHYAPGSQNTIELDYFFTPEVITMEGMFDGAEYEYLDLRSFDTNKCTNFGYMFYGTYSLITLDLSSFDIKTSDDVTSMFYDSSVETVYVKSQEIADYLESWQYDQNINFVVGSST